MIDIVIEIKGITGSGKTTLALAFQQFLKTNGFSNIKIDDFDVNNQAFNAERQDTRLKAIKDKNIVISTHQIFKQGTK